jgi:hypothetical protein
MFRGRVRARDIADSSTPDVYRSERLTGDMCRAVVWVVSVELPCLCSLHTESASLVLVPSCRSVLCVLHEIKIRAWAILRVFQIWSVELRMTVVVALFCRLL